MKAAKCPTWVKESPSGGGGGGGAIPPYTALQVWHHCLRECGK